MPETASLSIQAKCRLESESNCEQLQSTNNECPIGCEHLCVFMIFDVGSQEDGC